MPIFDALKLIRRPLVGVHLTNILQRPPPHTHCLVSRAANGMIRGPEPVGCPLAVRAVADALAASAP